ncbi:MAG TPA: CHASE3 domain-containing protein [Chthonomonadaceae bacterium]|nr:CHASE3 domain-containing protein [Chthonomonadaceae bacterium]
MIHAEKFRRILFSAVLLPILAMLILAGVLAWQISMLLEDARWVDHTDEVIAQANISLKSIVDQDAGLRGYLVGGDLRFLERYYRGQAARKDSLSALEKLISDNSDQQKQLREIRSSLNLWQSEAERLRTLYNTHADYKAAFESGQERDLLDRLREQFTTFVDVEDKLRAHRNARTQRSTRNVLISVFGLSLALGVLLSFLTSRRLTTLSTLYDEALTTERTAREQSEEAQKEIAAKSDEIHQLNTELEQRVQARTAELEAANQELEAFSYSVSHDLRAPLRSIDGFSQALQEDYAGAVDNLGKEYLQRIRANTRTMGDLIDGLLQLSRLTRSEIRYEEVNLSEIAQSIAAELQRHSPERDTRFVIADGVLAVGDPRLLRNVLENLLGNAWKFTARRCEAEITFGTTEEDGHTVYFVRDNGAGFDMIYVNKLFGAFQRLHGVSEFEGTGIGLATVQRVIHRHGGRIWAEGAVNRGATFYFTLPNNLAANA